jgi:hypothetical protein
VLESLPKRRRTFFDVAASEDCYGSQLVSLTNARYVSVVFRIARPGNWNNDIYNF